MNMKFNRALCITVLAVCPFLVKGQYVQPERDDTIRLYAKAPFDSVAARNALARGTATIAGEAFIRRNPYGNKAWHGNRINADKITILLFPVTPYLLEYLDLKKKENPRKLKFAYVNPVAWSYLLEAVSNSDGEFTFPNLKPGKYYLEAIMPWSHSGSYNQYTGSGYNNYGGRTDYYDRKSYFVNHYEKLTKFVEIKNDNETVRVKLK